MTSREDQLWGDAVRGLVLGLGCGDALGCAAVTDAAVTDAAVTDQAAASLDVVPAGVASQLTAFTIDGSIRALVRSRHKGIGHPPTVIWHAYCRWAWAQGLDPDGHHAEWSARTEGRWPDGWLSQVSVLGRRRGDAPATVRALKERRDTGGGTLSDHVTLSRGAHALVRTLPLAALSRVGATDVPQLTRETAALTHGDPIAQNASALAVRIAVEALSLSAGSASVGGVGEAVAAAMSKVPGALADVIEVMAVEQAERAAAQSPRDAATLADLAPGASVRSALLGGLYVALSFPSAAEVPEALAFATLAPYPPPVAAVAGALLGATYGVDALPADLIARLELGWVLDTLARDLVRQVLDNPSGGPYTDPTDPGWWARYPGW